MRKFRYFFWVLTELFQKYRRSLVVGFLVGLVVTIVGSRSTALFSLGSVSRSKNIGIVGEFSPTTLPLYIQHKISAGLTQLSENGTAVSGLALTWEATESGRRYLFHLRDDLFWHNDKPVVASDVNYNIRGVTFHPIDAKTLEVQLTTAYSPFPVITAKPLFQAGLRGFGPYKVGAVRLKGDKVDSLKLVPFRDKTVPSIEYRFYRTEAQAVIAFKRGDIDILEDFTSSSSLNNWGKLTISEETNYQRIVTVFFNLRKNNLLKEKAIRQALGYGLPEMSEERAWAPFSKYSWAYTDKVKKYSTDLVSAKKLITSASISSDSASLTLSTFPNLLDVATRIASSWTNLGIPTTVKVISGFDQNFEVLLSAQDLPPDPDQYPFWHSTQSQTNITGYTNVKIDKLLEDGRVEQNMEKRKAIYADFARRLIDDAPAIFLYYPKTYTIKRGK